MRYLLVLLLAGCAAAPDPRVDPADIEGGRVVLTTKGMAACFPDTTQPGPGRIICAPVLYEMAVRCFDPGPDKQWRCQGE